MSDIQGGMNFELVPNEILLTCFEYLDIFEIFHSFDRLNYRFYKLIRNIPLQLNLRNVQKIKFDQFCTKILLNPEIKRQIYSLHLSNRDTCGQIDAFLSFFSLKEFSHLRLLTLSGIEEPNVATLSSMLPSSSKLFSFHIIASKVETKEILNALPMFNLRTLSIPILNSIQTRIGATSFITKLTTHTCSLEHLLYHLFKYLPMLKYLNVHLVSKYNYPMEDNTNINKYNGVHLKQLIIDLFNYNFEDFEMFAKLIPNLKSLTIGATDQIGMINASNWKNLIESSLPYLNIFKFKFGGNRRYNHEAILKEFKHFQDDFWCKQHQWYTEHSLEKYSAFIYTIPYISNTLQLDLNSKRFPNESINDSNIFSKVIYASLCDEVVKDKCQYHFSNVESLVLFTSEQNRYTVGKLVDIHYLKMIVNLSNLTHLNTAHYGTTLTSSLLLEILKESPKLSWITIHPSNLIPLLNDDELCKYLNKMIRKLDIIDCPHPAFNNSDEMKKFCEIFSNIEQLICYIVEPNDIFVLLNQLPKLSSMNVHLPPLGDHESLCNLLEEESRKLNFIFCVEGMKTTLPNIRMWIGRNMN